MADDGDRLATPASDALRASGYWNPDWDAAAELDPAWTEKFLAMGVHPLTYGPLDPKVAEFICIAVDASCTHLYASGTQRHIRKAIDLGATREEITAVLQLVSVLGIHTMSLGGPLLLEELARARQQEGSGEREAMTGPTQTDAAAKQVAVARTDELAPGQRKLAFVDGRSIALFNIDGTIHAIDNSCPHNGASLASGRLEGTVLLCPAHGLRFDLAKTSAPDSGSLCLRRFPVQVVENTVTLLVDTA